ncbi:uncharacterized protein Z520_09055 [Fonsecaea multimorphosa CBS 102226]|uniref:Uncharacterized protein n=1 Tax=Fonsecaea multimorphosa CBS 102226 TaxID=1442371 RepID=A0A0D2JX91_9EURO|nr:uncharacterized protein Z520_09055 [Fonsecaea multimorphosa CBS 102226]KIX95139.1 hypothetical protein Z520_09055 [Fonsecaea multimorphosa CBS 102226]OAL20860.1 hypothetical protein AYO22_08488 [Fonsecaea multimorphosa]
MNHFGAGRRASRSFYGKLFNVVPEPDALDSQHSLDPIIPAAKRSYTVQSFSSPQERFVEYEKIELSDVSTPNPNPAPTFGQPLEMPKEAIRKGFWPNSHKLLPHLAASAVTVAVVQLSFRNRYWMDLMDPNVQILPGITQGGAMNALQLAAKLHELILVASLGTIVMHVAQAHLVGNHGLPLGMLANTFAIGSGDYMRTKGFWSSIWSAKAHYWRFGLLSVLATILATLAGPSSAIAVIPSLNWFSVDKPFDNDVLPFYIFNESTVLWPDNVTGASENAPNSGIDCVTAAITTTEQDACPAGGFRDTYSWAGNLLFSNSSAGSNISFPDARGDTRRVLSTQSCASDFDGRASGVSLNSFISGALTAYWTFAQNNWQGLALTTAQPKLSLPGPIYAPKVEVMCNGFDYYNVSEVEARTHVNFPSFTPDKQLPSPDYILPYHSTLNDTTFDWVQMPAGTDNPAIGAAVRVPWEYIEVDDDNQLRQATEIHACSIYAQWVPVDVFYEPRTSDQVAFNVKGELTNTCLSSMPHEKAAVHQPVKNMTIDMAFANAINQNITFVTGPVPAIVGMLNQAVFPDDRVTDQVLNAFKSPFVGSAKTGANANLTDDEVRQSRATMISTILAGVITDGLARIAGNGLYPYSASMFLTNETQDGSLVGRFPVSSAQGGEDTVLNSTAADTRNWLRIDPVFERYGYGYRWEGSKTVQFGIIVLLIHVAIAAIHSLFLIYKVVIQKEGLVAAWTTVAELITLAMNSSPSPRLQDTCAGVMAAKTWRQVVTVRETYPGHLEMVVGPEEKAKHPQPQAGRYYGHVAEKRDILDEGEA